MPVTILASPPAQHELSNTHTTIQAQQHVLRNIHMCPKKSSWNVHFTHDKQRLLGSLKTQDAADKAIQMLQSSTALNLDSIDEIVNPIYYAMRDNTFKQHLHFVLKKM